MNLEGRTNAFESVTALNRLSFSLTGAGEALGPARRRRDRRIPQSDRCEPRDRAAASCARIPAGETKVALIADSLWQSRFARDPQITGKTIKLDGVPHQVIGVMPAGFDYPFHAVVWTPSPSA